jgi:hypothetical protein
LVNWGNPAHIVIATVSCNDLFVIVAGKSFSKLQPLDGLRVDFKQASLVIQLSVEGTHGLDWKSEPGQMEATVIGKRVFIVFKNSTRKIFLETRPTNLREQPDG